MAQPQTVQVTSVSKPDLTRKKKYYLYAIQLADPGAPTYPAGGIVVNMSYASVLNGGNWERAKWSDIALPSNSDITCEVAPQGYAGDLVLQQAAANPTMANFVLRIYTAEGTELGAGVAIPAALFAAAIANAPQMVFKIRGANFKA